MGQLQRRSCCVSELFGPSWPPLRRNGEFLDILTFLLYPQLSLQGYTMTSRMIYHEYRRSTSSLIYDDEAGSETETYLHYNDSFEELPRLNTSHSCCSMTSTSRCTSTPAQTSQLSDEESSMSNQSSPSKTIRKRKSKASDLMENEEWRECINRLTFIPFHRAVTIDDFLHDRNFRYNPSKDITNVLKCYFPWFQCPKARFRQVLAIKIRQGHTIQCVVDATNWFLQQQFTDDQREMIINYYHSMEIPILSECLTTIIEVSRHVHAILVHQNPLLTSATLVHRLSLSNIHFIESPVYHDHNNPYDPEETPIVHSTKRDYTRAVNQKAIATIQRGDSDIDEDIVNIFKEQNEI